MYFLHISDTHYLRDYNTNPDLFHDAFLNLTSPLMKLKKIQQQVKKPLDFICHCGDVTHAGEKEDYENMRDAFGTLFPNVPLIVTAGNHDSRELVQEVFYGQVKPLFVNKNTFAAGEDKLHILSFDNTNTRYDKGEIEEETCQWLLEQLQSAPEEDHILLCHHHCVEGQVEAPSATLHPLFSQVLGQKNVKAMITGHTHFGYEGTLEKVPYYTVEPLSFQAKSLGGGELQVFDGGGFHLFSYEKGKITLETVGDLGFHDEIGRAFRPT